MIAMQDNRQLQRKGENRAMHPVQVIAVTGGKGGVGKSTLTFNLAQNISKNAKVAVLDFDLQGSLSQLSDMVTDFEIIPFKETRKYVQNILSYSVIYGYRMGRDLPLLTEKELHQRL